MNIKLTANIRFGVPVTDEMVGLLTKLSEHHYDAKCKMAGSGFLAMWDAIIESWAECEGLTPADRTVMIDWNDLATCLKLLEIASALRLSDAERAICIDISKSFNGALNLANKCFREWQTTYESA